MPNAEPDGLILGRLEVGHSNKTVQEPDSESSHSGIVDNLAIIVNRHRVLIATMAALLSAIGGARYFLDSGRISQKQHELKVVQTETRGGLNSLLDELIYLETQLATLNLHSIQGQGLSAEQVAELEGLRQELKEQIAKVREQHGVH